MSKQVSTLILIVMLLSLSACSGSDNSGSDNSGSANSGSDRTATQLLAGEQLAKKNCKACHGQGINGAPIIGNKKMWGPRITKGREALVMNAFNGYGLMPAKGGNESITKEEIDLVVGYFLSELEAQ